MSVAWTNVLGVKVSAIDLDATAVVIAGWIAARDRHYVCVSGVHGVMESQRDAQLKEIHNRAGLVTPDGMPLVWLSRLAGHQETSRVYGPDLMLHLFKASAAHGWRHYFYGTTPDTLNRLTTRMGARFPQVEIVGAYAPPFRTLTAAEDEAETLAIQRAGPDIVWVGLSTPKQERWMAAHRHRLNAPVLIGVGAAFDFHAGKLRQAPRVVQAAGFEWAFRLAMEPRRLWRRYLRNNPAFMAAILMQGTGMRRYPIA